MYSAAAAPATSVRDKMNSPTVTPSVVYDDASAGIDWLTRILGLKLLIGL